MGRRIQGEFSPPRELVVIAASRMSGDGTVDVSSAGLTFEGSIQGATVPIPVWTSIAVLIVGAAISTFVPQIQGILTGVTVLVVCAVLWTRYRAEYGLTGVFPIPWADVEHVVRLASAPDVLAFVFSRPLAGGRTPEQVFFTPASGLDVLVDALRTDAPASLVIDIESALRPPPHETEEAAEG